MRQLTIYIDAHEEEEPPVGEDSSSPDDRRKEQQWVATEIIMAVGELDYGSIVSALITAKYDNDSMQAIVNNHLLEDGDPDHEAAFNAMQDWRKESKRLAKQITNELFSVE